MAWPVVNDRISALGAALICPRIPSRMDGPRFQISDPDVLDSRVDPEKSISSALALIERITETDIAADWLEAVRSRVGTTSIS